jgi:cbb3-type cytochrome oxidase subunit 1
VYSLVRRYIKTAIGFLLVGLALGGWMVVRRELFLRAPTAYEASAHTHAILVGFVMMMILGVALWMFPRPDKTDTRYRPSHIEAAYWLVTVATSARIVAELARPHTASMTVRWVVVLASIGQVAGIAIFFNAMWTRIRPVGSQQRERQGERF